MRFIVAGEVALILVLFVGAFFYVFDFLDGKEIYEDQAYKQLLGVAGSKADRVGDFLSNRKADAVFLSESEEVRKLFYGELEDSVGSMMEKIESISKQTAGDVETYLLEHPDMTLEDLKNDEVFQSIAVRDVGETGYTYVNSRFEGVLEFHPDPKARGKTYHVWKEPFPFIWKLNDDVATSVPCKDSHGFYNWEDIDGNVREKFTYHSCIDGETADGYSFYVGASTYLDEYGQSIKLGRDLDLEFRSFQEEKGYSDLIFINPEGDVVWAAGDGNEVGTNLVYGRYNESLLAGVFEKAKKDLEVGVSDSKEYGEEGLNLFITAPIMGLDEVSGKKKLIGVLALRLDNEKIIELVEGDVGLGEKGEVYIVNMDRNHVTPLKFDEVKIGDTHHAISSSRIEDCFKDYSNVDGVNKFGEGKNYVGLDVFGAHSYVLGSGWCVIVEMNQEEFLEGTPQMFRIFVLAILVSMICLWMVCFILDGLFKINKEKSDEV